MRVLAVAGASAALVLVPLAAASTFGRAAEIPLSTSPVRVAVGDATTEDRIPYLVTANASRPGLSVLPGHADGSFEKPVDHPELTAARGLVFGDFDADGTEDLGVATSSAIVVYAGTGGRLVRRESYAARAPGSLAMGDIDNDGNFDIVAASPSRPVVILLLGRGDGTFLVPVEVPIGAPASSLVVTDLDDDGALDVVAAGRSLFFLSGRGDGSFQRFSTRTVPFPLRAITTEVLDPDPAPDLVVAGGQSQLLVLINDGQGGFPTAEAYRAGAVPVALALGDVDFDGTFDILAANRASNDLSVLKGRGDGSFEAQTRVKTGRAPTGVAAADLNADNRTDAVVANAASKSLTVLLSGTDAPQPTVCLVPRVVRRSLAIASGLVLRAHCALGLVHRRYSDRVRRGRVIAQTPAAGVVAPEGTAVTLVVSRGPRR